MRTLEDPLLTEALHWRSLLVKAVEEKGEDYVYASQVQVMSSGFVTPACSYVEYRERKPVGPSCIVGHALYYDGMPIKEIAALDRHGAISDVRVAEHTPGIHSRVRRALRQAQKKQDAELTWGYALRAYDDDCATIPGYTEATK